MLQFHRWEILFLKEVFSNGLKVRLRELHYVAVGEYVEADEIVAVVETDKVNVDIRSSHAGVVTKFFAEEGDTVEVGGNFFEVDTA